MYLPTCLILAALAVPTNGPPQATPVTVAPRPVTVAPQPVAVAPQAVAMASQAAATATDAADLAARFAPQLVFHPLEEFFPSSPLFVLEAGSRPNSPPLSREDALATLGTAEERRDAYLALELEQKARLATVYYRINELPSATVIEYWFYYVWNEYSAREGLFPFRFNTSHPNDMEHMQVVLRGDRRVGPDESDAGADALVPEVMYVSAHEGIAPSNRYYFDADEPADGVSLLIERGSHAAGADADRDGVFTPGPDGESGYKMLWGVRDRGVAWSWYKPSYMDRRDNGDAVRLCPDVPAAAVCPEGSFSYRLAPVDELYGRFNELGLSRSEIEAAFENDVSAFKRFFGRSNGDAEKLVLPPPPLPDKPTVPINGFSSTERGFMFGATTVTSAPGFFFGARYSFLTGSRFVPDLMLQVDPVLTIDGEGFFSSAAMLSYPIGAVTKVIGGVGFVTDFDEDQWDWIGGFEFKLSGFRISFTGRTGGNVTNSAMDLRLYYFF